MKTAQLNPNTSSALGKLQSRIVGDKLLDLPIDAVEEDPANPREHFDAEKLRELAESIRATHNRLIHPIVVREVGLNRWRIIDGARRFRACRDILKLQRVQCILPADVASVTLMQLIANDQHENLTPIERAQVLQRLREEDPEAFPNLEALGKVCGRGKAWVSKHLQLLELPAPILELAHSGRVTDLDSLYLLQKLPEDLLDEAVTQLQTSTNPRELLRSMTAEHREADMASGPALPSPAGGAKKPPKSKPAAPKAAKDPVVRRVHQACTALGLPTPVVKSAPDGVTVITLALDAAALERFEHLKPPR